ncbi:MAG: hypothetical protein Q4B43_09905 [Bacteroidota bacterium]|nr:hypothetical protein [Bacteroidota bacterium]
MNKTETIDLRTTLQKEREERNKAIYQYYKQIKSKVSEWESERSIYRLISEDYDMSIEGIRKVVSTSPLQDPPFPFSKWF